MGDLISRKYIIEAITAFQHVISVVVNENSFLEILDAVKELIEGAPSIQSNQRTGMWIDSGEYYANCSECGYQIDIHESRGYYKFCPNCGKKMEQ